MPLRVFVPPTWDGKTAMPITCMLHGAGANENTYLDQADGLLPRLAAHKIELDPSPLRHAV